MNGHLDELGHCRACGESEMISAVTRVCLSCGAGGSYHLRAYRRFSDEGQVASVYKPDGTRLADARYVGDAADFVNELNRLRGLILSVSVAADALAGRVAAGDPQNNSDDYSRELARRVFAATQEAAK